MNEQQEAEARDWVTRGHGLTNDEARDLLVEVDRLRAQLMNVERYVERVSAKPANAWDQGHESAIDGCPCRNPDARDCVNPYRQALS